MSQIAGDHRALIVRVSSSLCALPLKWVVEIMRPLAVEPVAGTPAFVMGLSILRGHPAPVVHMAALLHGHNTGTVTRFVSVRSAERRLLLAVEAVVGIESLQGIALDQLPPLLEKSSPETIAAIGAADYRLMLMLRETRVLSDEVELLLAGREASP